MLSHRTLYLHALDIITGFRDLDQMVDLHTIPLFHANGWGRPQMSTMLGKKQVMVRRFEPSHVFRLIAEHAATHAHARFVATVIGQGPSPRGSCA